MVDIKGKVEVLVEIMVSWNKESGELSCIDMGMVSVFGTNMGTGYDIFQKKLRYW